MNINDHNLLFDKKALIVIKKHVNGDEVEYPEEVFCGTGDNIHNSISIIEERVNGWLSNAKTKNTDISNLEALNIPHYYLRGIVHVGNTSYAFTVKIDLLYFSEYDLKQILKTVKDRIKNGYIDSNIVEYRFPKGMTVKELKAIVQTWPEIDKYTGDECTVWLTHYDTGRSKPVTNITSLNKRIDDGIESADLLFE